MAGVNGLSVVTMSHDTRLVARPSTQYTYVAHVTEVYDGDTVTVDIDLGFNNWIHDEKLRLFGINSPEVRGVERPEGLVSRDWLRDLLLNKVILIESVRDKRGKYGRYLATLFVQSERGWVDINSELVRRGLAVFKSY